LSDVPHQVTDMPKSSASAPATLVLLGRSVMTILVIMFALSLHRAFVANLNWDEFYYLSQVHQYRNGVLLLQLQTLHVHLFGWLPFVSDNEIHQIFAARVFLWLLSIASCRLIYEIARKFCSKEAALLSALFYFGFSYVVDHGLSFRYDPICAFLFLASLYLLLGADRTRFHMAISGFLMAVAMLFTVKSIFYLGTIGTVFLAFFLFEQNRRAILEDALVFAAALSGSFLVLYQAHSYVLASEALTDASTLIKDAGTKTLLSAQFLPRINIIRNALFQNGPVWVLVSLGLVKAGHGLFKGADRKDALILVSFAVPLLSLLFYRNAYPYFYVFLMPAAVILGGVFADVLITNYRRSGSKVVLLILGGTVLMISGSVLGDYIRKLPDQTSAQAETVALVHRMFPGPTPYIDRNSMISSYPKVGFFMSTWGMENYRARNRPVMEDLIRREQPKFMIANTCVLDISQRRTGDQTICQYRLLDEDLETLRASFVHHWGAIYVAGQAFDLPEPSEPESFEILISGSYTLEAEAAVTIDGVIYRPGDQVRLDQQVHTISAPDTATRAVLRWGADLHKPSHEPSPQPIYYQF
jgi:hypothetical protein